MKFWRDLLILASSLLKFSGDTRNFLVIGPSMVPTIGPRPSLLLVERNSPRLGKVEPGDIVIVLSPENPQKFLCKRLLALEGAAVKFIVDPRNIHKCMTVVVLKGHIWVQGDNIFHSRDSRQFGPVPYGLLYAKVFWRVWPGFGPLGKN